MVDSRRRTATAAIHTRQAATSARPLSSPIFQSTAFAAASADDLARVAGEVATPDFYTRHGNPNHVELAEAVATLERAEAGLVLGSGMGALTTTLLALVSSGQHIVAQRSMYGGSLSVVQKLLPRFGVTYTLVDQAEAGAWAEAITPATRVFLIESPSNPRLEISDLGAIAEVARARDIVTVADNTFATPINQRPVEAGIDLVWHSATKYLAGHSDASAGVVVGRAELIETIWNTSLNVGAVLGPIDAWLVTRGIRTLDLRVGRHNATALAIAEHLRAHPTVEAVYYPGLPGHASHAVAARQMSGFGGVLSIELPGDREETARSIERLELFQLSASLGSVESLVVHPASMWGAVLTDQQMSAAGVAPGLVRLACGLEDAADLIADLDRALHAHRPRGGGQ